MGSVIYAPDDTFSGRSIGEIDDTDATWIEMEWSYPVLC